MKELKKPKISFNLISFSGNSAAFKNFMSAMVHDYLNSDNLPNIEPKKSVDKVENSRESA